MIKLSTQLEDCKYHIECQNFRTDIECQACCADLDELAWTFAANGFVWTGQRFYRPAGGPGVSPLLARVLDQSTQEFLSTDDLEALVVPLFYRWAESSAARVTAGVG